MLTVVYSVTHLRSLQNAQSHKSRDFWVRSYASVAMTDQYKESLSNKTQGLNAKIVLSIKSPPLAWTSHFQNCGWPNRLDKPATKGGARHELSGLTRSHRPGWASKATVGALSWPCGGKRERTIRYTGQQLGRAQVLRSSRNCHVNKVITSLIVRKIRRENGSDQHSTHSAGMIYPKYSVRPA